MEDIDVWRSANLLIEQYEARAIVVACEREIEMLKREDFDGAEAWQKIILAIDKLMRGATAGPVC